MIDSAEAEESPAEALLRARRHARRGVSELILAVRALLDAAALGLSHQPARDHALFAPLSQILDDWSTTMGGSEDDIGTLILDALETEIARWESRSREDEEARSVLRAFLGLREFLWEMGIRSKQDSSPSASAKNKAPTVNPTAKATRETSRVRP